MQQKEENILKAVKVCQSNNNARYINLTLYPAISWVTPGNGPTVARLTFSCTMKLQNSLYGFV